MLTEIEQFLFEANRAHLLLGVEKYETEFVIMISPIDDLSKSKSFSFKQTQDLSEENVWKESVNVDFPTNIIGFDSTKRSNETWKFCLHTDEVEWNFISNWPESITKISSEPE